MIVCSGENISRHYGPEPVFVDLSFQIQQGERIGLVGPNGAGKSTLMRVLAGQDEPDSGVFNVPNNMRVAMLRQFPDFPPGRTLIQEARAAMAHLEKWYDQMIRAGEQLAQATTDDDQKKWGKQYDHYQELLQQHGGYDFQHRIEEVLFGLGFVPEQFERELGTFSGGQQSRVLLAQLLLASPDLMLLDEPTNHLDIETTEWLENFLGRQSAAMVVVSHDRFFLDRAVNKIMEMHAQKLHMYPGNYTQYAKLRDERQKVAGRVRTKQQETIAHHQEFIKKNAYGQLAKQAKSREKMVARLQEAQPEVLDSIESPSINFAQEVERTGDVVFTAKELSKSFDQKLFDDVNLEVRRGERVGIIGRNGTGKTNLMKIMLGQEPPTSGSAKLGHKVNVGYLQQDLNALPGDQTPLDVVRPPWRVAEKAEPFRALLARFGIDADMVDQRLDTLSGGERTRVALARLCAFDHNVLALDEPTNHLDLWARESLELALREFPGTIIVVSHDRYFLNQLVDRVLWLHEGVFNDIIGNYDRYLEYRQRLLEEQESKKKASKPAPVVKSEESTGKKPKRKFPFRKTSEIEADIAQAEETITQLEANLQDPEFYKDGNKIKEVHDQLTAQQESLSQLMEHWEEAMELNPPG